MPNPGDFASNPDRDPPKLLAIASAKLGLRLACGAPKSCFDHLPARGGNTQRERQANEIFA